MKRISSAATQVGVFHFNYFLELDIASPHLASGEGYSTHEVMVMRNLEDGVHSFAIDEFPVMDEDAIEEFWIRKVEAHKKMREESFAEMEREYLEQFADSGADAELYARLEKMGTGELRKVARDPDALPYEKEAAHAVLDARWRKLEEMEGGQKGGREEL